MLCLGRQFGEDLIIDIPANCPPGPLLVRVVEVNGRRTVRLGIVAPPEVKVRRRELLTDLEQKAVRRLVDGGKAAV